MRRSALRGARGPAAIVFVTAAAGAMTFMHAPWAVASCHAFTVSASPASVAEGSTVTVTVERDGTANASQVSVTTVDGTAHGDEDFDRVHRELAFTTETAQTFQMRILEDTQPEADETFRLHLEHPEGCGGSGYVLGPDATVTITEKVVTTAAPAAPPATPAPAARVRTATTRAAAVATPAPTPVPTAEVHTDDEHASDDHTTASATPEAVSAQAAAKPSGRGKANLIVVGVALVLAATALTLLPFRRRRG